MTNIVSIQTVNLTDAYDLAEIEKECFSIPWSKKALEESICEDMYIFLKAVINDEIVGYVSLYKSFDEGDVVNLAVKAVCRGKKVATLLMEALLQKCHTEGIKRILLEVRRSNLPAISLYKKFGFSEIALRKNFYDKPQEDAVIMEHILLESITTIY